VYNLFFHRNISIHRYIVYIVNRNSNFQKYGFLIGRKNRLDKNVQCEHYLYHNQT